MSDAPMLKLAEGTAPGTDRTLLPGDVVAVDCRGMDPALALFGWRVGTIARLDYSAASREPVPVGAWVRLPGWADELHAELPALELIHRPKL